jgi:hypothetical protein
VLYRIEEHTEAPPVTEEQKITQNLKAVENAVAQQTLEGLEVPPDVVEEMKRAARGEIEIEEGIRNTVRRFTHGKVRGERPLP